MTDRPLSGDSSGFKPEDELDELFSEANPNPTRTGCPTREALMAVARKRSVLDDPIYEHISNCSECYRDLRRMQLEHSSFGLRRMSPIWRVVAAAVLLIASTIGVTFYVYQRKLHDEGPETQLDLRPYATTRGIEQRGQLPRVILPHRDGIVVIVLPTGSEAGEYEIEIRDETLAPKLSAKGEAKLEKQTTRLRVRADLTALKRGDYQVAVRRSGDGWQVFPAQVP